ncbi:MAG: molybdopterin-synthase adenylyltransferase MoeB [Leptospiraceae bacterium]|nr:molybdopterin-synthase adenylyltransferase MoeB [Leptospiraceae bacterium]MCK6382366.1 molybdopterin-synthase adenylyltransferase MoeB [Leptospiraceae bacterium]NUM40706.1 molybdopterin-synthase adenylyltransferase MoeB [Leptospiraceae bacterium]
MQSTKSKNEQKNPNFTLSKEEITRYSRNILLNEVGKKGQEKLKNSTVTVMGAGGLGSPALFYLAACGIGNIRIIDSDILDLTNLQRQILHRTENISKLKTDSAEETLHSLNPWINIKKFSFRGKADNILSIIEGSDIVLEGSDNFETKFLINDACYFLKIPLIIGGILRFEGQLIGILPDSTPCYRCIFHSPPPPDEIPSCAEAGVIGGVAGVIGSLQATEAIKFILKIEESRVFGKILNYDAKSLDFRKISINKNPNCPLCGKNPLITELHDSVSRVC